MKLSEIKMRKEDKHHGHNVGLLAAKIATYLELNNKICSNLYKAGLLHDYGKALLKDEILNKKGKLTKEEFEHIKNHPILSAKIIKKMGYNDFIVSSVLYHHENFDGTGYPKGLYGNDIPLGARILRVCDMYAALKENRIYRPKYSNEEALKIMQSSIVFLDPVIFKVFKILYEEKKVL